MAFFRYWKWLHVDTTMPEYVEQFCIRTPKGAVVLDMNKHGVYEMLYEIFNDVIPNANSNHTTDWEPYQSYKCDMDARVQAIRKDMRMWRLEMFKEYYVESIEESVAKGRILSKLGWAFLFLEARKNFPSHPVFSITWMHLRQQNEQWLKAFQAYVLALPASIRPRKTKLSAMYARVCLHPLRPNAIVLFNLDATRLNKKHRSQGILTILR